MTNPYKMESEGHITAEFKFDIIKIFKCHFRMHNCVVVSFRMNMIVIQTMTNPYRMPNINTKGLYTTIIPLSSMKTYEFNCNYEEVNIMVTKNLVALGRLSLNALMWWQLNHWEWFLAQQLRLLSIYAVNVADLQLSMLLRIDHLECIWISHILCS